MALRAAGGGVLVTLHVQPGAAGDGLAGMHGDALKVRTRAPAQAGRANEAVLELLARCLGVPVSRLVLRSGRTSRRKTVLVSGLSLDATEGRLAAALGGEAHGRPGG